jgi:hypothetical protein
MLRPLALRPGGRGPNRTHHSLQIAHSVEPLPLAPFRALTEPSGPSIPARLRDHTVRTVRGHPFDRTMGGCDGAAEQASWSRRPPAACPGGHCSLSEIFVALGVPIVAHSEQRTNHPSLRGNISSRHKLPMPEPILAYGLAAALSNSEKISLFLGLDGLPSGRRHPYNSASFG